MQNRWSEKEADEFVERYITKWGEDIALRTYSARLLGAEPYLVLHGGGNTSVKSIHTNVMGEKIAAIFVKASGYDMASIEPEGHPGLDLQYLLKLNVLPKISDEDMLNELRTHMFEHDAPTPSIESLMHAFIPHRYIDHTHADAILTLTNRKDGREIVREVFGDEVIILDYVKPGFELAKAVAEALDANPGTKAIVLMHHGLITWGDEAKESYDKHIELVNRAKVFIAQGTGQPIEDLEGGARRRFMDEMTSNKIGELITSPSTTEAQRLLQIYPQVLPVLRGLLAQPTGNPDRPFRKMIVTLVGDASLNPNFLAHNEFELPKEVCLTPPVTTDHLIRTKTLPMRVEIPEDADQEQIKKLLIDAVEEYEREYKKYFERNSARLKPGVEPFDSKPRVILIPSWMPIVCGQDMDSALITADLTLHTLEIKKNISDMGATYAGLPETELFDMEYLPMQHAKLAKRKALPLEGHIALVTGAAGAIGAGICKGLLENGCHVVGADVDEGGLRSLYIELREDFNNRFFDVTMDITKPDSIREALNNILINWGGLDIVVHCAGVAHVSTIAEMDIEMFRRLERINTEGTLLVLKEIAPIYEAQGMGGDVVLISTKNVFAPGAGFGAYSATKAASHQLGRIASLEFAKMDVRVNMVSPDAVFSDEAGRKSGLWQEVGPDRMKARGLDQEGLEEYYQKRNLLQAKVTAEHCANAVLFFVTHQTPTTGATIPVDGGLPDATPR